MSTDTPSDKAVFTLCEWTAGALIFGAIEWLFAGKSIGTSIIVIILATVLIGVGVKWPTLKLTLGPRLFKFTSGVEQVASNYRYRTGGIIVLILAVLMTLSFRLHALRSDLDAYVMPRTVTDSQAANIQKILSANDMAITVKLFANTGDPEATQYGSYLGNAIGGGGGEWKSDFTALSPWDASNSWLNGDNFYTIYTALDSGLVVRSCTTGPAVTADSKHPTPDAILSKALNETHIQFSLSPRFDCGKNSLVVVVGRRPLDISQQQNLPLSARLGRWLMNFKW